MQNEDYTTSEWTRDEWERAWHLRVGAAYSCSKCGSVIMITKAASERSSPIAATSR
ncbi:MAG: hypothetical protein HQ583_07905 [Candidatus Abyssubacteria bacterium]|nr:hypothetical protein [Candidatus Abyssubacteria bacterium]